MHCHFLHLEKDDGKGVDNDKKTHIWTWEFHGMPTEFPLPRKQRMMCILCQELVNCMSWPKNCKTFELIVDFYSCMNDNCDFDIKLVSTWRDKREHAIVTASWSKVFLSGGSCCRNVVGTCVSRRLLDQISGMTFFAISGGICCLHFTNGQYNFRTFSCYMPTSCKPDDAAGYVVM